MSVSVHECACVHMCVCVCMCVCMCVYMCIYVCVCRRPGVAAIVCRVVIRVRAEWYCHHGVEAICILAGERRRFEFKVRA
jgi:hypothetical protein